MTDEPTIPPPTPVQGAKEVSEIEQRVKELERQIGETHRLWNSERMNWSRYVRRLNDGRDKQHAVNKALLEWVKGKDRGDEPSLASLWHTLEEAVK